MPLTAREEAALRILREAVESGRGRIDSTDPDWVESDYRRLRTRLLLSLRYHGRRRGGHPMIHRTEQVQ